MESQTPDNGAAQEATEQTPQPETYIGTYKTKEDAEKGFQEKDNHIRQIEAENRLMREQVQASRVAPTTQQPDDDAQFLEKLKTSFDDEQRDVVEKLIDRKVSRIVAPIRQRFEEAEKVQVINSIKQDFSDYNNPEVVESVKNKILEYADSGVKLNLYDAYLLVKGRDAIAKNKEYSSRSRQDDFVDGGTGSMPRAIDQGVNSQLDALLGKRDPNYGKMHL